MQTNKKHILYACYRQQLLLSEIYCCENVIAFINGVLYYKKLSLEKYVL